MLTPGVPGDPQPEGWPEAHRGMWAAMGVYITVAWHWWTDPARQRSILRGLPAIVLMVVTFLLLPALGVRNAITPGLWVLNAVSLLQYTGVTLRNARLPGQQRPGLWKWMAAALACVALTVFEGWYFGLPW